MSQRINFLHPSSANLMANCLPNPDPAPVMRTTSLPLMSLYLSDPGTKNNAIDLKIRAIT